MTDSEAAAWTRGHAVGMKELKAAEQRWQVERDEARAEVERLREVAGQALEALENTTPTGFNMERDKQFFAATTALRNALKEPK